MCALGYYLERADLMTTGISLVRENAASMQPPRSLWVSFPLGRPLGVPNDAAFQHRVIAAALGLLLLERGPVLTDFAEDAPAAAGESAPACPVSFARAGAETWPVQLELEAAELRPWYELGRKRRNGRTLVGVSQLSIEENLAKLGDYLQAEQLPTGELGWFKRAIEDLKAFYIEALTAQPGNHDHTLVYRTLWFDTRLGAALRWFHDRFAEHPKLSGFARIVLPREALGDSPGAPAAPQGD